MPLGRVERGGRGIGVVKRLHRLAGSGLAHELLRLLQLQGLKDEEPGGYYLKINRVFVREKRFFFLGGGGGGGGPIFSCFYIKPSNFIRFCFYREERKFSSFIV